MCICNYCQPTLKFGMYYSVVLQSVLLICECLIYGVQNIHSALCYG
jgi:hypothetical protein